MNPYQEHLTRHSDIREHLGLLHGLAMQCTSFGIVELGFRTGVSASAFLAAGAKLWSLDIDAGCKKHVRNLAHRYPDTFTFKIGDSRSVDIPKCEMLFIDTDHTYDTTIAELQRHADDVTRWIVLHDTVSFGRKDRAPGKGSGVLTAAEDWHESHDEWALLLHLPNNNGLTILQRYRK